MYHYGDKKKVETPPFIYLFINCEACNVTNKDQNFLNFLN